MNDALLDRKLRSVGKEMFVKNFDVFARHHAGTINEDQAIAELVENEKEKDKDKDPGGAEMCVRMAREIFEAGRERDALLIIIDPIESPRVPPGTKARARDILNDLPSKPEHQPHAPEPEHRSPEPELCLEPPDDPEYQTPAPAVKEPTPVPKLNDRPSTPAPKNQPSESQKKPSQAHLYLWLCAVAVVMSFVAVVVAVK